MPIRLRITLLFSLLVFIILALVCGGVYYSSYNSRLKAIKLRLTNRAITTARLLSQQELFDRTLIQRIDSSTTLALKNKTVEAFNYQNHRIYFYADVAGDSLALSPEILNEARVQGNYFFYTGNKEAVAYHYTDDSSRMVVVTGAEDVQGWDALNSLGRILLISFLVGNILVLVMGYFFSGRLLAPVKAITSDVAEISARNLARRLSTGTSRDEWYQLATTLNELLNRLQDSFDLQRRFISNASHELSTPLTSISSQLQITLQRERGAEEYKKVMESVYSDVQHMNKLTQTLLDFAKASGDPGGLILQPVRVDELLLNLPSAVQRSGKDYKVVLNFENLPEDEKGLIVFGNEALLFTAIYNIVVNACKYSDDRTARIGLDRVEERIRIRVEDQGKGISQEELNNIFQPFYRIDEDRANKGFGLGLPLAERIIKIHKGYITLESEKGRGSRFEIELPAATEVF